METLYERDGITLDGTVRMVTRGAGVCQVLEDRESPTGYEEMKANHGQLLHDFTDEVEISVRGSGESGTFVVIVGCSPEGVRVRVMNDAYRREVLESWDSTIDTVAEAFAAAALISPDEVEVRWDGGEIERVVLASASGDFVQKLVAHRELRIRATARNDRFDLTGVAGELANLPCQ